MSQDNPWKKSWWSLNRFEINLAISSKPLPRPSLRSSWIPGRVSMVLTHLRQQSQYDRWSQERVTTYSMLNTRSLVNRVRYQKNVGWWVGFGYPLSTGYSQHVQRGRQALHCLIGRHGHMVTHSVWPKAAASINAVQPSLSTWYSFDWKCNISVHFCLFNIAHCIDGVDSGMPANPGHGPRVISSTCYVQSGEPVVILYHL